jgi:hypothetical protein
VFGACDGGRWRCIGGGGYQDGESSDACGLAARGTGVGAGPTGGISGALVGERTGGRVGVGDGTALGAATGAAFGVAIGGGGLCVGGKAGIGGRPMGGR